MQKRIEAMRDPLKEVREFFKQKPSIHDPLKDVREMQKRIEAMRDPLKNVREMQKKFEAMRDPLNKIRQRIGETGFSLGLLEGFSAPLASIKPLWQEEKLREDAQMDMRTFLEPLREISDMASRQLVAHGIPETDLEVWAVETAQPLGEALLQLTGEELDAVSGDIFTWLELVAKDLGQNRACEILLIGLIVFFKTNQVGAVVWGLYLIVHSMLSRLLFENNDNDS